MIGEFDFVELGDEKTGFEILNGYYFAWNSTTVVVFDAEKRPVFRHQGKHIAVCPVADAVAIAEDGQSEILIYSFKSNSFQTISIPKQNSHSNHTFESSYFDPIRSQAIFSVARPYYQFALNIQRNDTVLLPNHIEMEFVHFFPFRDIQVGVSNFEFQCLSVFFGLGRSSGTKIIPKAFHFHEAINAVGLSEYGDRLMVLSADDSLVELIEFDLLQLVTIRRTDLSAHFTTECRGRLEHLPNCVFHYRDLIFFAGLNGELIFIHDDGSIVVKQFFSIQICAIRVTPEGGVHMLSLNGKASFFDCNTLSKFLPFCDSNVGNEELIETTTNYSDELFIEDFWVLEEQGDQQRGNRDRSS